jgi:hypothetical protein
MDSFVPGAAFYAFYALWVLCVLCVLCVDAIRRVHAGMLGARGLGLVVHFPSFDVAEINIP